MTKENTRNTCVIENRNIFSLAPKKVLLQLHDTL